MSLVIRLRPQGNKNRQTFRLVVMEKRSPRNGAYKEMLGWYNPLGVDQQQIRVKTDRLQFWLNHGAQISENALSIVNKVSSEARQLIHARKMAKLLKRREKAKKSDKTPKKAATKKAVESKKTAAPKKKKAVKKAEPKK